MTFLIQTERPQERRPLMKRTIISLLRTAAMLLSLAADLPIRAEVADTAKPGIPLTVGGRC